MLSGKNWPSNHFLHLTNACFLLIISKYDLISRLLEVLSGHFMANQRSEPLITVKPKHIFVRFFFFFVFHYQMFFKCLKIKPYINSCVSTELSSVNDQLSNTAQRYRKKRTVYRLSWKKISQKQFSKQKYIF